MGGKGLRLYFACDFAGGNLLLKRWWWLNTASVQINMHTLALLCLVGLAPLCLQAAQTPYFTDFESGAGTEWSNTTTDNTYPEAFSRFTGRFGNQGQTLSLSNLTVGASYTISYDLYVLDSWDGGGDTMGIQVDGFDAFKYTFSNYNGNPPSNPQSYPDNPDVGRYDMGFSGYVDAIYRNVEVPFVASNAVVHITFQGSGLQDINDESWGVDNVGVKLTSQLEDTYVRLSTLPAQASTNALIIDQFTISASRNLLSTSVTNLANYSLKEAGANGTLGNADDVAVPFDISTSGKDVRFTLKSAPLQPGRYRFMVLSTLLDANGKAVTAFTRDFAVSNPPLGLIEPLVNGSIQDAAALPVAETPTGTGFYTAAGLGVFSSVGELDYWSFDAEAQDRVTIRLETEKTGVYPRLFLQNANGDNVQTVYGDGNGVALLQNYTITTPGTYFIRAWTDSAVSKYRVRVDQSRGPQLESEDNSSQANANAASLSILTGAYQARVAGSLPVGDGSGDWYNVGVLNPGNAISVVATPVAGSGIPLSNLVLSVESSGSGNGVALATNATGLLNYTVVSNDVHFVRISTAGTNLNWRAQYYITISIVDGVPPVVVSASVPSANGVTTNLVDSIRVVFSENLNASITMLGHRGGAYKGHYYYPTTNVMTWKDAEAQAQTMGAHLVTVNDALENKWLRENFIALGSFWIGLTDETNEGTFLWTSEQPVSFVNWNSGEPNNSNNEDYVQMAASGAWSDASATLQTYGVVETTSLGPDQDGDGIPDAWDPFPKDRFNGLQLRAAGADGAFGTADDVYYQPYFDGVPAGTEAVIRIADGPLQAGKYQFILSGALRDRVGNALAVNYTNLFQVSVAEGYAQEQRFSDSAFGASPLGTFASGNPDGSLIGLSEILTGRNPEGIAAGDFNGDGQVDLVSANYGAGTITVMTGQGDGTFVVATNQAVGRSSVNVLTADFNKDGKLDLAVANYSDSSVAIMLGNGNGTFQTATYFAVGTRPIGMATGDINKDGKVDLVVANVNSDNASVLIGNGDGTFAAAVNYACGNQPFSAVLGDLNKDGLLDLVTANRESDNVSILFGKNDGTFGTSTNFVAGDGPRCAGIGDVDKDGNMDIVVANSIGQTVSVLKGDGAGHFQTKVDYAHTASDVYNCNLVDINGDGYLDILLMGYGNSQLVTMLNLKNGTFGTGVVYPCGGNAIAAVTGDFNKDGLTDVAAVNYYGNTATVFLGRAQQVLVESPVGSGVRTAAGRGNLQDSGDIDYWSFSGQAGDRCSIAVETIGSPGASQLYYLLRSASGANLVDFYPSYNGWGQSAPVVLPYSGNYTVEVRRNYDYFGEYRLRVTLASPPIQLEREDNSSISAANAPSLTLDAGHRKATQLGYISIGDGNGDYFYLGAMAEGTVINLGARKPATSGLAAELAIFDGSGNLMTNSAVGAAGLSYTIPSGKGGTYYARLLGGSIQGGQGGASGYALDFNGANYVTMPDAASLDVTNQFTLEAWVYPQQFSGQDRAVISKVGGTGGNNGYQFGFSSDGKLWMSFNSPGQSWGSANGVSTSPLDILNRWTHVAATYDNDTIRLYVNGQLTASNTVGARAVVNSTSTLRISGDDNNHVYFDGLIDEVRLWNIARSQASLVADKDRGLTGAESGLAGYWNLNEGVGGTVMDRTANKNNGTLAGSTLPRWVLLGDSILPSAGILAQYLLDIDLASANAPVIVQTSLPVENSTNLNIIDRFSMVFNKDMMVGSITNQASYDLRSAGPDGNFDTSDDATYQVVNKDYTGGFTVNYQISDGPLQPGKYRFTARTLLKDSFGNALAANYVQRFVIQGVAGFVMESRSNGSMNNATPLALTSSGKPAGSFNATSQYAVAGNPHHLALGKFNGDTNWDLVTANYNGDNISVFTGNGDGTFVLTTNYPTGNGAVMADVGDVNKDGKADLVVANYRANHFTVLLGSGAGTFTNLTNYATGVNPYGIGLGDFNKDGNLDVACGNTGSDNIQIFLGAGDGTFGSATNLSVGDQPNRLVVVDLNKDAKLDIVVANYSGDSLSILMGHGDGAFDTALTISVGDGPRAVAVADVNNDGKLDLVVPLGVSQKVSVLNGNGDGTFGEPTVYNTGLNDVYDVIAVDLNQDGNLDLALAGYGSSRLGIMLNAGGGKFESIAHYSLGSGTIGVVAAEFNGDGLIDLATANYGENTLSVLLGELRVNLAEDPSGSGMRTGAGRGNLSNTSDYDYWSFYGAAGDLVSIAVSAPGSPSASQLYFRIDDPAGNYLTDFYPNYNGWGQSTPVTLPLTGTYTVYARYNYDYQSEYRLRVTTLSPPKQLEKEDNNNVSQANNVSLVLTNGHQLAQIAGYVSVGDDSGDYFKLGNLSSGTAISLGFKQPQSSWLNAVLGIFNSGGTMVTNSPIAATNLTYVVGDGQEGAYYARVLATQPGALYIAGNSERVNVGAWSPGSQWTVEAWVKAVSAPSGRRTIAGGLNSCLDWAITMESGQFGLATKPPGACSISYRSTNTVVLNRWYHVAGTCDGTNAFLYVDGELAATGAVENNYVGTPSGTWIGNEACCTSSTFPGYIEEVRIWNRPLAVTEIRSNRLKTLNGDEAGLAGYWKLNEGFGTMAYDSSTNHHNGTLESGARWAYSDLSGFASVTPSTFAVLDPLYAQYILSIDLSDSQPPMVTGVTLPTSGTTTQTLVDRFSISFNKDMMAATVVDPGTYDLRSSGADSQFATADDAVYAISCDGYTSGLSASYHIPDGPLQPGQYRFTVKNSLQDRSGNPLPTNFVVTFGVTNIAGYVFEGRNNNSRNLATSLATKPSNAPDGSLGSAGTVSADSGTRWVVVGKMNADNHSDLVAANYNADNISVILGNGDGTFQAATQYAAGNGPIAVVLADWNGDGKTDVTVANYQANSLSVLLGNGDGTLTSLTNIATGAKPLALASADYNGDGRPDLAVACNGNNNIRVYTVTGAGVFTLAGTFSVGTNPETIHAGDLNKDSKQDLVVGNFNSDNVSVLLGNGDGTFKDAVQYATGDGPAAVTVGDVNKDGLLDVVAAHYNHTSMSVLLGNGDGTLGGATNYSTALGTPYAMDLADLNGDGSLDLVVPSFNGSQFAILLNNGNGGFGEPFLYSCGSGASKAVVADFNEDGRLDVVTANRNSGNISIFLGNPVKELVEDPAGTGVRSVGGRGILTAASDVDYWSFSGKAGEWVSIASEVAGNPGASSLHFRLEDPNGSSVVDYYAEYYGYGQSTPVQLPTSGTYALRVEHYYDYLGEYRFRVTTAPALIQLEREANNNTSQANTVDMPLVNKHRLATVLGYLGTYDSAGDYFRLGNLVADTTIGLKFRLPDSSALWPVLSVFDGNGTLVTNTISEQTSLSYTIPSGGDGSYYARVTSGDYGNRPALKLDGSSQSIDLGNWFGYQAFTISMWIKPGGSQGTYADILDNNHRSGINWVIQQNGSDQNYYIWGNSDGASTVYFSLSPNRWNHLVITRDTNRLNSIYVNGVLAGASVGTGDINYNGQQTLAFGRWGGGGRNWNGLVDELHMWSRPLSAGEVVADMNSTTMPSDSSVVGWWSFNEGSGAAVQDRSGNAHNGTLVNNPVWGTFSDRSLDTLFAQYLLDIDLSDATSPAITGVTFPAEGTTNSAIIDRFTLSFSKDLLSTSVTDVATYELRGAGPDGVMDTSDDYLYTLASDGYTTGLSASFQVVNGPLQPGLHRFTVLTVLQDRSGNTLAQPYIRYFHVGSVAGFFVENQDNNTAAKATPITMVESPAGLKSGGGRGNLRNSSDVDFWSFEGNTNEVLMIGMDIPGNPGGSQLHFEVFAPNGTRIQDLYPDYYGKGQSSALVLATNGTFTVRVSPYYNYFNEYRFRVSLAVPPMQMEVEDNNTIAKASPVTLAVSGDSRYANIAGYIQNNGDLDYFNLGALTNGSTVFLSVRLPSTSKLAPVVSLYDSDGKYLSEAAGGRPSDGVAQVQITKDGTYIALIRGAEGIGGLTEQYVLDVQTVPTGNVSFPNLQVTSIVLPTGPVTSGGSIAFAFGVTNVGALATPGASWSDRAVLSINTVMGDEDDIPLGIYPHIGSLAPGAGYKVNASGAIPDGVGGPFYIIVQTDFGNLVNEFLLEADNTTVSDQTFSVILANYADLKVENLHIGDPVDGVYPLSWTIANRGNASVNKSFKERIYVKNVASGAVLLNSERAVADSLAVGGTLARSAQVTTSAAGIYQVLITADSGNNIFEYETAGHAAAELNTAEGSFQITQAFNISVQANPANGGSVTGGGSYGVGSIATLVATPNTNAMPYYFLNWTENGVFQTATNQYRFTVTRDRVLVANFTLPSYQISGVSDPSEGGYVTGSGTYFHGTTNTLKATANPGYLFTNWTEKGSVVAIQPELTVVASANRSLVAHFVEANVFHVVSTATLPANLVPIAGAGTYSNGQTYIFRAPSNITNGPTAYAFKRFSVNGATASTNTAFTKRFSTVDATNMVLVAEYEGRSILPVLIGASGSISNPVPITTNYLLSLQFDRSMNPAYEPVVTLTNAALTVQTQVRTGGVWRTTAVTNDTYVTPSISFGTGMDGTHKVWAIGGRDTNGLALALTNALQVVVDAVPPVQPVVSLTSSNATSATISWATYTAPSDLARFRVYLQPVSTTTGLALVTVIGPEKRSFQFTGLSLDVNYYAAIEPVDQAGNTPATLNTLPILLPTTMPPQVSIAATPVGANSARIAWPTYDTSQLFGFAGFQLYVREANFINVLGQTPAATFGPGIRETTVDNLDRTRKYFFAIVGVNRTNGFLRGVKTAAWSDPYAGELTRDTTIGSAGQVVDIYQSISVNSNATLTLPAGTTLRFAAGAGLTVEQGRLMAEGTALDPVVFTSMKDSDGGTPAAGDWEGVVLKGSAASSSRLTHVWVKFGKGLVLDACQPTLDAFTALYNAPCGISLLNGAGATTESALIAFNQVGVQQAGLARLNIRNSVIKNNTTNAIALNALSMIATQNWWGTPISAEITGRLSGSVNADSYLAYEPLLTPAMGTVINSLKVSTPVVDLKLASRTAESMRVSEDSSFANVFFAPFTNRLAFALSEGGGSKSIYAQFRSTTGNTNVPLVLNLEYITSGPKIQAFSLSEGITLHRPVQVSGLASAVLGVKKMELFVDGVLVYSANGGSISYLWDIRGLTPGIHRAKLLASDNGGNFATSERNVVIDPTPPPAPVILQPGADLVQTTPTINVSGTAEKGIGIRLTRNGTLVATTAADASGAFSVNAASLVEGLNELVAIAFDSIGSTRSATRQVVLDTGAPSMVVLDAPAYRPGYGLDLTWHYLTQGERPTRFQVYWHTNNFNSSSQASGLSPILDAAGYTISGLADGKYYIGVVGLDAAGNRSALSDRVSYFYDSTRPSFVISYDRQSPVGMGALTVRLASSEPLAFMPTLSFKAPGAVGPQSISITNTSETTYEGVLTITGATPSGEVTWSVSGQDLAGNTYSGAPKGSPLVIDVIPPQGIITTVPQGPVQTLVPTNVVVTLGLTEPVAAGSVPTLQFNPPTGTVVNVTLSGSGTNWNGLLPLHPSMGSGFGAFVFGARDVVNNVGSNLLSGATLEIYNTAQPSAPSAPAGLAAESLSGGQIKLRWGAVSNAEIYRLYREAGTNNVAPTVLVLDNVMSNQVVDVPLADGKYRYAVTASRRGSESTNGNIVVANSDRTPPPAPTNIVVQLASAGVQISWQQPAGEKPDHFNVYRNGALVKTLVSGTTIIDVPPRGVANYTVGASDALGNENLSAQASIQMLVGAVGNLQVLINQGQAPVLTWTSDDSTAVGYNVYRNGVKQNATLLTTASYVDLLPVGDSVITYAVRAENAKAEESAPRTVDVYPIALDLFANAQGSTTNGALVTRYFDDYQVVVTNLTAATAMPVQALELRRTVDSGSALTRVMPVSQTIGGGNWLGRDVVFASAATLDAQSMRVRVVQDTGVSGSSVIYQRVFDFTRVSDPGLMMSLASSQPPLAGGLASFDVRMYNRGYADINVIVTRANGAKPGDIYIAVKNPLGQEVSRTEYNGTPKGTFFMNDGRAYVRIVPGASVAFTVADVLVPEALSSQEYATFEVVASKIYHHLGSSDQLESGPLRGSMDSSLKQTDYYGTATASQAVYSNEDPIIITGKAIDRAKGTPVPNAALKIGFSTRGFRWFKEIVTDATGKYTYEYHTQPGFGGTLTMWAAHPLVFDALNQTQVTVYKMYANPSYGDIRMSKNDTMRFGVSLFNPADVPLTQLKTEYVVYRMDGTNQIPVTTVRGTNRIDSSLQIEPGKSRDVVLELAADPNAPDEVVVEAVISTAEGARARFTGYVTLLPAVPLVVVMDPPIGYLEVSLNRGSQLSRQVTILNRGLKDLQGVELFAPTNVTWMNVNLPVSPDGKIRLPDLGIGKSNTFTVVFTPPADVKMDYYHDVIKVKGTNTPADFDIDLYSLVTSDQKGSVQFFVDNNLGLTVSNATVRLRSGLLQVELPPSITDSNGLVTIHDLQEGDWSWQASAPGHSTTAGTVAVVPSQTVQVHARLAKSLVTVNFSVVPVPYTDKYEIKIEQTFETHVPAGVLVVDPPFKNFEKIQPGFEANFIATVKNYGLLEMTDLTIKGSESQGGVLTPLIEYVPLMLPMQTIEVPFTFTYNTSGEGQQGIKTRQRKPSGQDIADCIVGAAPFGGALSADVWRGLAAILQARERCISDLSPQTALTSIGIIYGIGQLAAAWGSFAEFTVGFIGQALGCIIGNFFDPGGGGNTNYPGPRSDSSYNCDAFPCFGTDTKVWMADGSWKEIQNIRSTDKVRTGLRDTQVATVRHTYTNASSNVLEVKLADAMTGAIKRNLVVTGEHLMWVDGKGWVAACNLKVGDWLSTFDGANYKVAEMKATKQVIPVYSLQLEGDSAFYANGVLVHDMCGGQLGGLTLLRKEAAQ